MRAKEGGFSSSCIEEGQEMKSCLLSPSLFYLSPHLKTIFRRAGLMGVAPGEEEGRDMSLLPLVMLILLWTQDWIAFSIPMN